MIRLKERLETFAETVTDLQRTRRPCCGGRRVDVGPLNGPFDQPGSDSSNLTSSV